MAIVNGTTGDDSLFGTTAGDVIDGLGGNDSIYGLDGADTIHGGAGDDFIFGGPGNDVIYSDAGADIIWGDAGSDHIFGNGTMDMMVSYSQDPAAVNVNLRFGTAVDGWGSLDILSQVYVVGGSNFNDTLDATGSTSNIGFISNGGDDSINGGWGNDVLFGMDGNDTLNGGDGISGISDSTWGTAYRLYRATLSREPDVKGFENWAYALSHGMSVETAASQFLGSPEFQATYGGLDNTQFVTLLYNNVLGRAPDATGLSNWVHALNSGVSRASVVVGFSDSTEFKNNTAMEVDAYVTSQVSNEHQGQIYRLYQATLDRNPDSTGFLNWMNALDTGGQSLRSVASGFVGSAEFNATYGSLNNEQFVTLLYNNVLNRAPDAGGLSNWVNALNHGMSRADVVVGFSDSAEFRSTSSSGFKNYMTSSFGSWSDWLEGGAGNDVMVGGRGVDAFSFRNSDAGGSNDVYGLENLDRLWFSGYGYSGASDVMSHMAQDGHNVMFSDAGQSITFHNVTLAQVAQTSIFVTT
jgi:Ca2+-binding RTX toxin-like protein